MKASINVDLLRATLVLRMAGFFVVAVTFFYLGKHWSNGYQQLIFFTTTTTRISTPKVSTSPNFSQFFNASALIDRYRIQSKKTLEPEGPIKIFGILNENGTMSDDFEVGDFDPVTGDEWVNEIRIEDSGSAAPKYAIKKLGMCPRSMSEYIPCLDNAEAIQKLESTERGERFERHCPEEGKRFNCLVPPPKGYRAPIPWPRSRDEVWYSNIPHNRLVEDKEDQNWIFRDKDKFKFPGGGTQFIHGADKYLDRISEMVPDITFGQHIRVALDIGCGVASFGAYLLSRNVVTMSVAPKDVHENQIQFALERGVPAMVAAFATRRLLYPSQAFDLVHCSRCRINWTRDDGILLLEVNRMLRAGGYFVWAAQPVYKHEEVLEEQWEEMLNLTTRLCWKFLKKDGYVAIWQKPSDNSCYLNREAGTKPLLCDPRDDPDNIWVSICSDCRKHLFIVGMVLNITSGSDCRKHLFIDSSHQITTAC